MRSDKNTESPKRCRPTHGVLRFRDMPTIVFVTVCTKKRQRWLANEDAHELLVDIWTRSKAWHVGRYILMPDHCHFFCTPASGDISLENWMKYWKRLWSCELKRPDRKWQSGYWDTRLRRGESYHEKWEYVQQNPVRAGLVEVPSQWKYQGAMHEIRWEG